MKTARQLERHFKGVANHWRIDILLLVANNEGIVLDVIAKTLGGNFKTIAEHIRRLVHAGLVDKKYQGRQVAHSLSPYGKKMIACIRTFSLS